MQGTIILWSHALVALLFAGVALTRLHEAGTALPRLTFVVAPSQHEDSQRREQHRRQRMAPIAYKLQENAHR